MYPFFAFIIKILFYFLFPMIFFLKHNIFSKKNCYKIYSSNHFFLFIHKRNFFINSNYFFVIFEKIIINPNNQFIKFLTICFFENPVNIMNRGFSVFKLTITEQLLIILLNYLCITYVLLMYF